MGLLSEIIQMKQFEREKEMADINAIGSAVENFVTIKQLNQDRVRQASIDELNRRNIESQIMSRNNQLKFSQFKDLNTVLDVAEKTLNKPLRDKAKSALDELITGEPSDQRVVDDFIAENPDKTDISDLIPTKFNAFGEPTEYESKSTIGAKKREQKISEANFKREVFSQDLESFFAVDDQLKRGTGFYDRIVHGFKTVGKGLDQSTAEGFASAAHDAARKRLRVQLVRAAGDVGNINIVEQKAAEQMIPGKFDAKGTAELKRSYLKEIGKAIGDQDANAVKSAISRFMESDVYDGPKGKEAGKIIQPSKAEILEELKRRGKR